MKIKDAKNLRWSNDNHDTIVADVQWEGNTATGDDYIPCSLVGSGDRDYIHHAFALCMAGIFGDIALYESPKETRKQRLDAYHTIVQKRLHEHLSQLGYSSTQEAYTYTSSIVDKWREETLAAFRWRDVMEHILFSLAEGDLPDMETFLSYLPAQP